MPKLQIDFICHLRSQVQQSWEVSVEWWWAFVKGMGRWSGCGQLLKQHAFSPSFSSEISIVDTHTCILSSFKVRSRHDPTQSEMDGRRQWKYFFWVYTLARSERKTKTQWEYLTQSRWVTNLVVLRWYLWTPTKRAVTALPASTHIHLRGELYHSPKGKGEVAIKNEKGELRRPSISKAHKCLWKRQFSPNPVTV